MDYRLTVIMVADVANYSRLMGEDQTGTITALKKLREQLFRPLVAANNGKIIKNMGDGWIVGFESVFDAVTCGIELQEELTNWQTLLLRIGIHTGEVVFEDEDVFGDGINIAARLEELAEPGDVLISDTTFHSLDTKGAEQFVGGNSCQLKNIARAVQVWSWRGHFRWSVPASLAQTGDRPTVAVLSFENKSDDAEQEFFSDGIADDIITELSRFSWLKIISQSSSFSYKGQAVDLRQIGHELGARYVLEGSVRKAANRVRISAQLTDTRSGSHVWAERYDRKLDDIFAVQDEVTRAITQAVAPNLELAEMALSRQREPANLDSWELTHRAHSEFYRMDKNNTHRANALHRLAVERDPNAALARAYLALGLTASVLFRQTDTPDEVLIEAESQARSALELDRKNTIALWALGQVALLSGEAEKACRYYSRAIEINANDSRILGALGQGHIMCGRYEAGIGNIRAAVDISPRDPQLATAYSNLAFAYFQLDQLEHALEWVNKSLEEAPDHGPALRCAAAINVSLGNVELARSQVDKLKIVDPTITISSIANMPMFSSGADMERFLAALRKTRLK